VTISKTQIEQRLKNFVETCRQNGLKVTHQRTEVFRELAASEEHPDAETIYQQVRQRLPALSRDTVYRILADLETLGLVHKAEILFHRGRYDANTDRHHHFVCTQCGLVRDFYCKHLDELPLPKSLGTVGSVQSTHVQVRGICSACATKPSPDKNHSL
jgi:Fur family transcriptional regulator, peroxide stress response regulator